VLLWRFASRYVRIWAAFKPLTAVDEGAIGIAALMQHRRHFLRLIGTGAVAASFCPACARLEPRRTSFKPIRGSWISVWWDDRRHFYWNDSCLKFTERQWQGAVQDAADLGMKYLVLLAIAKGGKAFYPTPLLPQLETACPEPIEAMLTAADRCGMRFFISSDWYGDWDYKALADADRARKRFQMMEEVARRYSHHRSFYGWYWPNEACLSPYFTDDFIRYVNTCSREARRLTPKAKTLTAPYGTAKARCDDTFVRQLEQLDVDIIAYQDEVGCLRMGPAESGRAFDLLRQAHARVPQRALWADVETFAWEGPPNRPESPLIPAPWERVRQQLEAVSPFVDEILIYQYQGLMNRPRSRAFAGHQQSVELYAGYLDWLKRNGLR
jgi:hypothetical protein